MTEDELIARDSQRNIAGEILESLQELKVGNWSRQTAFEIQADGTVRRTITRSDGTVEKEELLSGPRWQMLAARSRSGLSQLAFARALGVSKRTLENWEQGRVEPSGAARRLLALAARYPDTLERLSKME